MTPEPFLMGMFSTPDVEQITSPRGWLQAMLDAEAALARAHAAAGTIPSQAAAAIAAACDARLYDSPAMRAGAVRSATPVVPLVEALRRRVGPDFAGHVHLGATSQDIVDTAMMLMAARTTASALTDIDIAAFAMARLARDHRGTLMVARTLLQPALPTTFGLKCAGWLDALLDARGGLQRLRDERLAVQLGGAAGTLASLGAGGPDIVERFAAELGLRAPSVPWHTARARIIDTSAAFALVAGSAAKAATDIILLAQPEVAEVALEQPGRGRSSAMPHKRNPAAAVLAVAAGKQAAAHAATLLSLQVQPHERAAGDWQAEWQPFTLLLQCACASVHYLAATLAVLDVRPDAMRRNLDALNGLPMAESLAAALANHADPVEARAHVERLCERVMAEGSTLAAEALADEFVVGHLDDLALAAALDPERYLGSAGLFIDRALARFGQS